MILHYSIIVLAFIPIISSLLLAYQTMRAGFNIWGVASISPKFLFYLGKGITMGVFILLVVSAIMPNFYWCFPGTIQDNIPSAQRALALVFLLAGNILLLPAQYELSIFTRIGLPKGAHTLCTDGVYKISRNPMYMGLFFFFAACFMLNPSLGVVLVLILCLLIHFAIIRSEEQFLTNHFGDKYIKYQANTARFL